MVLSTFFIAGAALAQTQSITLLPDSLVAYAGETIAVNAQYDVIDGNKKTTGIGIRIHFNSKFIDNVALADVYGEGMVGQHYSPKADVKDLDGDSTTDQYIIVAWAGITGDWPVFLSMPGKLATINVQLKKDAPNAETTINVTTSATAAGYDFVSKSMKILVQ